MTKENKLEKRILILDRKALPLISKRIKDELKKYAEKEGINLHVEFAETIKTLPEDYDAYVIHPSEIKDLEDLKRIKQDNPKCRIYMLSAQMPQIPDNFKMYFDDSISPTDFYEEDIWHYKKQIVLALK